MAKNTLVIILLFLSIQTMSAQRGYYGDYHTPRDTLFIRSGQYPSAETDELILRSNGKSITLYTVPTADGSSLGFFPVTAVPRTVKIAL